MYSRCWINFGLTLEELSRVPQSMAFQSYLLCFSPIAAKANQDHWCFFGAAVVIDEDQQRSRWVYWWLESIEEYDFEQQYSMAKKSDFFAGSREYGFFIANGHHINNIGGLLHRRGRRRATLSRRPFRQTGQVVTSIPQILSNCSCQVSCLIISFVTVLPVPRNSRHIAILSLRLLFASRPKWRILT